MRDARKRDAERMFASPQRTTNDGPSSSRRKLLKQVVGAAFAGCAFAKLGRAFPESLSNPVGYATISWPERDFAKALETISALGFKGIQALGWVRDTYAGPKTAELKERLQTLKLKPVALSASKVKLDPAQLRDESGELRDYTKFFQRLGGTFLQVTDGGRPGEKYRADQITALGQQMNQLGRIAQDHGLFLGYHPHFGTLGETREGLGRVLDSTDLRYVGLIADVAHLTLGGSDPAEVIRTYHERLRFLHFKDLRGDAAELARKNPDLARGKKYLFCEIGRGVVNFPAVLQALHETRFGGWIIIELDGYEPPAGGPSESARINKEAAQRLGLGV